MPTFKTDQLVRDKRLGWLQKKGISVAHERVTGEAYITALKEKLLEEATEAHEAKTDAELLKELSDVQETIYALVKAYGHAVEDLEREVQDRKADLGSFDHGVYIKTVTVEAGSEDEDYYRQHPEKYPEVDA